MNIAELKGEKTIKTLAKHLLAPPSKDTPKENQAEMEAALLRLNPQLNQIGDLEQGTPIVVPDGFALAPNQSTPPARGLAEALLQRAESAIESLRAALEQQGAQSASDSDQVQTWVKSDQAKNLVRQSPDLKEVFSSAASAATRSAKELPATLAAENKALDKVKEQIMAFRGTHSM